MLLKFRSVGTIRENLAAVERLLELDFLTAGTRSELEAYRQELTADLQELVGTETEEPSARSAPGC